MGLHSTDLAFIVGFILESLLLIKGLRRDDAKSFLWCLGFTIVVTSFYALKGERGASVVTLACVSYTIFFIGIFKDRLLRVIGPELLILWSAIFLYAAHEKHSSLWTVVGGILVIVNGVNYLRPLGKNTILRTYFYASYLLLVCGVTLLSVSLVGHTLHDLLFNQQLKTSSSITAFIAGMAITGIAVNAAYIYDLIPGRGNSIKQAEASARELAVHYDPAHSNAPMMLVGIALIVLLLALNAVLHVVSPGVCVAVAIILSPLFSQESRLASGKLTGTAARAS